MPGSDPIPPENLAARPNGGSGSPIGVDFGQLPIPPGELPDPAGEIVAAFNNKDLTLVYLNASGRKCLDPGSHSPLSELHLDDLLSLPERTHFHRHLRIQLEIVRKWTGQLELSDTWGGVVLCQVHLSIHRHKGVEYLILHGNVIRDGIASAATRLTDRELLNVLMETVPDSIYFKDRQSRFVRMSRAQARKFGLASPNNAVGKTDFEFFTATHAAAAYRDEQRIIATGEPMIGAEEEETWEDGSTTWVSTTKLPLRDAEGNVIGTFGISRDITAIKTLESERRERLAELEVTHRLEAIGRLAAGIAHEINTPSQYVSDNLRFLTTSFQSIRNLVDSYKQLKAVARTRAADPLITAALDALDAAEKEAEYDYLADEIVRTLEQTTEGMNRIARIVRSLKEFSHPSSGNMEPSDLNRTIETAINVSRHEWKYVAKVQTELAPDLPLVPCNVDQVNQCLLNLIVNAAHAISDSLPAKNRSQGVMTLRTKVAGPNAIIEVEDDGVGITPEARPRIFQPFFTTKEVGRGSGQGLSIVKAIVEKNHGGKIEFESTVGKGTVFRIYLPLTRPVPDAKSAPATEPAQNPHP